MTINMHLSLPFYLNKKEQLASVQECKERKRTAWVQREGQMGKKRNEQMRKTETERGIKGKKKKTGKV